MARRFRILSLAVLAFGCKGGETLILGNWEQQAKSNGLRANMGGSKNKLELTPEHKFVLTFQVPDMTNIRIPKNLKIEGTWNLSDKQITFQTVSVDGKSLADYEKDEEDQVKTLSTTSAQPDMSNMTPEEQAKATKFQANLAKLLDSSRLKAPVPVSGVLSDSRYTLTIDCGKGQSLEFGKLQAR